MPRVFLVKKTSSTSGKKKWNEIPDCARGDIYTPGECLHGLYCSQSKYCHVNDFYMASCSLILKSFEIRPVC